MKAIIPSIVFYYLVKFKPNFIKSSRNLIRNNFLGSASKNPIARFRPVLFYFGKPFSLLIGTRVCVEVRHNNIFRTTPIQFAGTNILGVIIVSGTLSVLVCSEFLGI